MRLTADYNKPRLNRNGTVIIDVDMEPIYKRYKEKFDSVLGPVAEKSPTIGGNYFITPQQYGLQQDAMREKGYKGMCEKCAIESSTTQIHNLEEYNYTTLDWFTLRRIRWRSNCIF